MQTIRLNVSGSQETRSDVRSTVIIEVMGICTVTFRNKMVIRKRKKELE